MRVCVALLLLALIAPAAHADWPTARGNPQRTGCIDGQAGPVKGGNVLWAIESSDHFISAISPGDKGVIYVPALGALQSGVLQAISTDPAVSPDKRILWTKTQPTLKLPTVCSPAVVNGKVIIGDGMHQNSSPTIYCFSADKGVTLWQYSLPGDLIHIEGTPTILGDKVYFAAGDAGVVCLDAAKVSVTIDGQTLEGDAATAAIQKQWKALQEKYQQDLKKDPDFALAPSEDQLPKPAPKLLWQKSEEAGKKFHVDSPIAVVGDRVLMTSSNLSEGPRDCAIHCLDANDGKSKWRVELTHNPWGGATVAGDLVLVGCSSIRFDPAALDEAKGEVVALSLADGSIKWRKDVPGGVVSPVTVTNGLAIFTATDKKVRAFDLKTGNPAWAFDAKNAFFAGVAVAGDLAYACDLNGVLYAIKLADGKLAWRLDVGKEAKAPGHVYGSPVVHGGKIYVGTNAVALPDVKKTVLVCISEK
jgi:outer membrane protein assembly factor BamB